MPQPTTTAKPLSDEEIANLWFESGQRVRDFAHAIEARSTSPDVAELVAACENLRAIKGRYHTEQAFNRMVAALAKYKGEK